jgi:hypothetical protein
MVTAGTLRRDVGWQRGKPSGKLEEELEFLPPFEVGEVLDNRIDPLGDGAHEGGSGKRIRLDQSKQ